MEKDDANSRYSKRHRKPRRLAVLFFCLVLLFTGTIYVHGPVIWNAHSQVHQLPPYAAETLSYCRSLSQTPSTNTYSKRTVSDRFVPGTRPHLLKNARVWTGNQNGTEVVLANILLDNGLIKGVGRISPSSLASYADALVVIDLKGAWVTPGFVELSQTSLPWPTNCVSSTIALWTFIRISGTLPVQNSKAQVAMIIPERALFYLGFVRLTV